MADFGSARDDLAAARGAAARARAAARQAVQDQRAAEAALARSGAAFDPGDPAAVQEREALEAAARRAAVTAERTRKEAEAQLAATAGVFGIFDAFTDPRANVGRLEDRSPIALLPVGIETRFGRAPDDGRPQLWVRIYPDACSIDTYEETLSEAELGNARRYWQGIWRAGRAEDGERAAWRGLVAAHGSGRAGYIADAYGPLNGADQPPAKADPDDVILVIGVLSGAGPDAAETAALRTYWAAAWRAETDAARAAAQAALEGAVGAPRAAELVAAFIPYNFDEAPAAPLRKADVAVSVAVVVFPPDPPSKGASWAQAPQVTELPERFVVLGYRGGTLDLEALGAPVATPLYVGPDPAADPDAGIHPDGPDLVVPDELAWLVDFPKAVDAGMGLAIDLTADQFADGFDRLLVVGVQMGADDHEGRTRLEDLLRGHHRGRSGLSVVAQGTPAHNTTGQSAGHSRLDDPDASFDDRRDAPLFTPTGDPALRRDGEWVARALGIDPKVLEGVHGAGGADQLQARAMQRALWPATLGYWMDKLMAPVFDDGTVAEARAFFTQHVSGRGAVPALRIGAQPYGILPTTAFSRIRWLQKRRQPFLRELYAFWRAMDGDWKAMTADAAHVGRAGDPHQTLLDILGLHPGSVEHHWRYAETLTHLYNIISLWGLGPRFWEAVQQLGLQRAGADLLRRFGHDGPEPDLLSHVFFKRQGRIGELIDDRPLSETAPVRAYAEDGRNYLQWLADAGRTSLDALAREDGFADDRSPRALLYLMLRHALQLGYYDTSWLLHRSAEALPEERLAALRSEPAFVHVADAPADRVSESRYGLLVKDEPRITSTPGLLVSDYITNNIGRLWESEGLADQLAALDLLADAPTAQLERAFTEHLDVCSYRFDAWLLGLVGLQLEEMRARQEGNGDDNGAGVGGGGDGGFAGGGVYLGAYAWVEDLRPSASVRTPADVPDDLRDAFAGDAPLMHDDANAGYIHAPSLPHARTAAVLRAGYVANATPASPDTLSVNLSSERVRLALGVLEGIRNGQSLGALLGYRFERGLHDSHGLAEVDRFIYPLRKAFPLVADQLAPTQTDPDTPIEAIEARNVLDGRKLVARIRAEGGTATYPFGVAGLPAAGPAERVALDAQANALLDLNDAVADLALAEGVHQAVQGNFERAGGTLDAYATGTFPPEPEVVQTPSPGIGLTHRVALHLDPAAVAAAGATPRATAEPAIDAWLASVLPAPGGVGCRVSWTDAAGAPHHHDVTLADLGLAPIDLVDLVKPDDVQAMAELDDRIADAVRAGAVPPPRVDADVRIEYQTAPPGTRSVFAAAALLRALRTLLHHGRPLRATDARPQGAATEEQDAQVDSDPTALTALTADLAAVGADVGAFVATLQPLPPRATLLGTIDALIDDACALLERAARFGVPQSGWGFAHDWRRLAVSDLMALVGARVARWDERLAGFDAGLLAYDALPAATPDAERFVALQAAEALVVAELDPLPPDPAALRAALPGKRAAFAAKRDALAGVAGADHAGLAAPLASVHGALPVDAFDREPLDLTEIEDRVEAFAVRLADTLTGLGTAIADRVSATQTALAAAAAAPTATGRADGLATAAKALLGEAFVVLPRFTVGAAQAAEWANAMAASTAGALTSWLTTTGGIDAPVDEWLEGLARVRPALHAWEATATLAGAFGRPEPELTPVQLPHQDGAPWLALEFPEDYALDGERLLYTAHHAAAFAPAGPQCGLLLDEWTEVIPEATKDTSLAFGFDRPENEPGQAILLVTPATADGQWHWEDVVGALHETLDLAKRRALEPADLDATAYSRFLPATVTASTVYGISISMVMAASKDVIGVMDGHA